MTSCSPCFQCRSLPAPLGNTAASSAALSSSSSSRDSTMASVSTSTSTSTSGQFLGNGRSRIGSSSSSGFDFVCYIDSLAFRENYRSLHTGRSNVKASATDVCAWRSFLSADSGSTSWLRQIANLPRRNDCAPSEENQRTLRWLSGVRSKKPHNFVITAAANSEVHSSDIHHVEKAETLIGDLRSRRDVLVGCTSALGLAASNLWKSDFAKASVSQQVRLEDVEDQKLQEALRAAVSGELENAEDLFTELIRMDPESASGWSNRGSVRVSLGKYKLASDDFTKAIELAPTAPVPYLNRAISYEAQGFYEEAIADCKTAIQNDPEEPAAWFNLGNVEARVKEFDSSLLAYKKASDLAPGIAGYRLKQALILFQLGRMEEAKKLIQGLVRKYPTYTEAHAALAALLWNEGQRSKAEEQFTTATSQQPLYNKLSWVEAELQWPPGVVQAFSKFLAIDFSTPNSQ